MSESETMPGALLASTVVSRLVRPIVGRIKATGLPKRLELARRRRREFRKVRAELESYSERELMSDLRLKRSDIPALAAQAAEERVTPFPVGPVTIAHTRFRGGAL